MRKGQPQRRSLKLYFHILITNFIMRVKELLQSVLCRCVIESDLNRIKKAINKYSVISFDIFDTLLQRKVSTPSDVFDLVEKEYNKLSSIPIRGFKQIRIEAELKSKKQSLTEETNIYSIYNMLPYDKEVRDLLLQLELKIERIELSARQEIKALYDYAAFLRKEVIIISDMYLPVGFIEEILYSAMEDYKLDIIIGSDSSSRSIEIDLPPFTLVGATTRAGDLTGPLRDRFGIVSKLNYYTDEELMQIVKRTSRVLNCSITDDAALELAKRSRGTPRIANRLFKRVRDYALVLGDGEINLSIAKYALDKLKVDSLGLDQTDYNLLKSIIEKFNGGPVGIEAIASSIGEEQTTIEDVYEPFLLQKGLLKRTNRGRIVTDKAYKHLGINK